MLINSLTTAPVSQAWRRAASLRADLTLNKAKCPILGNPSFLRNPVTLVGQFHVGFLEAFSDQPRLTCRLRALKILRGAPEPACSLVKTAPLHAGASPCLRDCTLREDPHGEL